MARVQNWLALARSGPDGVRTVGDAILGSADPDQARIASLALLRSGVPEASAALRQALAARSAAIRAVVLEVVASDPGTPIAAALIERVDVEPVGWLRRRAIEALAAVSSAATESSADARAAVLARFSDPDPGVRAVAIAHARRHLAGLPRGAWMGRLRAAVSDPSAEVAWQATVALGEHAATEALQAATSHPNPFVRAQAAAQLAGHGGAPSSRMPPLTLDGVRRLRSDSPEDVELLAAALLHAADHDAVLAAIGRLAAATGRVAVEALAQAAESHPLPSVRERAVRALDGHATDRVWVAIGRYCANEADPERVRSAVWTLGRRREAGAWALLLSLATDPQRVAGAAAIAGLRSRVERSGHARTAAARSALRSALQSEDATVRADAEAALARFRAEPEPDER